MNDPWFVLEPHTTRIARMFRAGDLDDWGCFAELLLWMDARNAARIVSSWKRNPTMISEPELQQRASHAASLREGNPHE